VEEIEKFYINFQKLKETIEDEETGVSALFDYIQEQAEQANNVLESIDDVRSKSEKTLALIEQSKSETDNMKHQIS
jgi:methyl-accepting chemotaxis protein